MADLFDKLATGLLGREGGYVNHPSDRGGETIWGITVGTARRFGYHGPMAKMTRAEALVIYRGKYWAAPGFARVGEVSERIAEELFDTGVNMGVDALIPQKWLQRSLNVLNRQGVDYPDITADGVIGDRTLAALQSLIRVRGRALAEELILKALNCLQGARYIELAEGREKNEDFVVGWLRTRVGL